MMTLVDTDNLITLAIPLNTGIKYSDRLIHSCVNMDPRAATPGDIARARAFQTGYQADDVAKGSGLQVSEAKGAQ